MKTTILISALVAAIAVTGCANPEKPAAKGGGNGAPDTGSTVDTNGQTPEQKRLADLEAKKKELTDKANAEIADLEKKAIEAKKGKTPAQQKAIDDELAAKKAAILAKLQKAIADLSNPNKVLTPAEIAAKKKELTDKANADIADIDQKATAAKKGKSKAEQDKIDAKATADKAAITKKLQEELAALDKAAPSDTFAVLKKSLADKAALDIAAIDKKATEDKKGKSEADQKIINDKATADKAIISDRLKASNTLIDQTISQFAQIDKKAAEDKKGKSDADQKKIDDQATADKSAAYDNMVKAIAALDKKGDAPVVIETLSDAQKRDIAKIQQDSITAKQAIDQQAAKDRIGKSADQIAAIDAKVTKDKLDIDTKTNAAIAAIAKGTAVMDDKATKDAAEKARLEALKKQQDADTAAAKKKQDDAAAAKNKQDADAAAAAAKKKQDEEEAAKKAAAGKPVDLTKMKLSDLTQFSITIKATNAADIEKLMTPKQDGNSAVYLLAGKVVESLPAVPKASSSAKDIACAFRLDRGADESNYPASGTVIHFVRENSDHLLAKSSDADGKKMDNLYVFGCFKDGVDQSKLMVSDINTVLNGVLEITVLAPAAAPNDPNGNGH